MFQRSLFASSDNESVESKKLVKWLRSRQVNGGPVSFLHVPNELFRPERKSGYARWQHLKSMGFSKGAPDYLIFTVPNGCSAVGIAIEMKKQSGGKVTPAQSAWLDELRRCGWIAEVCNGAEEAIKLLISLGF